MSSSRDKDGDGVPSRRKDKSDPDRRANAGQIDLPGVRQALLRLTGAKLCYGKPIELSGRTVITVASVRSAGGFGFGKAAGDLEPEGPTGAGGGGAIEARSRSFRMLMGFGRPGIILGNCLLIAAQHVHAKTFARLQMSVRPRLMVDADQHQHRIE